jgi:hypothetical protein
VFGLHKKAVVFSSWLHIGWRIKLSIGAALSILFAEVPGGQDIKL